MWRSGRVVDWNPEGREIEFRKCCFWFWYIVGKLTEKLSENSFAWEQKTVGKFRWFRNVPPESSKLVRLTVGKFRWFWNIPSSLSELVGLTWSTCWKSFPSPLQVSLIHPVRLTEFSVNFFYNARPPHFSLLPSRTKLQCMEHTLQIHSLPYRITGGFLYAATSILKRVTGRVFTISKCFHISKPKLYLLFSPYQGSTKFFQLSAHIQKVLICSKKLFISWHNPF